MSSGLPRPGECRDCHDPIRFVQLDTGKALPVNPMPARDGRGNVAARLVNTPAGHRLVGFVISRDHQPDHRHDLRFTPHPSTCEAVDRTPTKPAPEPDPALF